jgi:hypothetical protein
MGKGYFPRDVDRDESGTDYVRAAHKLPYLYFAITVLQLTLHQYCP